MANVGDKIDDTWLRANLPKKRGRQRGFRLNNDVYFVREPKNLGRFERTGPGLELEYIDLLNYDIGEYLVIQFELIDPNHPNKQYHLVLKYTTAIDPPNIVFPTFIAIINNMLLNIYNYISSIDIFRLSIDVSFRRKMRNARLPRYDPISKDFYFWIGSLSIYPGLNGIIIVPQMSDNLMNYPLWLQGMGLDVDQEINNLRSQLQITNVLRPRPLSQFPAFAIP